MLCIPTWFLFICMCELLIKQNFINEFRSTFVALQWVGGIETKVPKNGLIWILTLLEVSSAQTFWFLTCEHPNRRQCFCMLVMHHAQCKSDAPFASTRISIRATPWPHILQNFPWPHKRAKFRLKQRMQTNLLHVCSKQKEISKCYRGRQHNRLRRAETRSYWPTYRAQRSTDVAKQPALTFAMMGTHPRHEPSSSVYL